MKKIKILIAVLIIGISVQGQFASTDALKTYIDQYITNNAINAFQNKRLNTALKGLVSQLDSTNSRIVGGVRSVDSLYLANDSTIVFSIRNTATGASATYSLPVHTSSGDSGVIYNEGLLIDITGTTIKVDTTAADLRYTAHWKNISGAGTVGAPFDPKQYVAPTLATLRGITPDAGTVYRIATATDVSDFVYDPSDVTSLDDSAMVIRNGAARFKRVVKDRFNLKWFDVSGLIGDNATNAGPALLKALNYIKAQGKSATLYIPKGYYAIYSTVEFNFGTTVTVNIAGEASGGRFSGSAFIWHGSSGQAMFKLQSMFMPTIENIDFVGRNSTGPLAKYLIHIDYAAPGLTSLINFKKCSFLGVGGDSSAAINFNATGSFTDLQADESTWDDCYFAGNGWNTPDSLKSWYGVRFGGNNTKNFTFRRNFFIGFREAAIKGNAPIGQLTSIRNNTTTNGYHFDLSAGTSLTSINDYAESNKAILHTAVGSTGVSSYSFINYEDHSSNYDGANPLYPVGDDYRMAGQGNLFLQGCTFNTASSRISKINWATDNGIQSLTAIGCNFWGVTSRGLTPFYSGANPVLTEDREADYGQFAKHRFTSIGNTGIDSLGVVAYGIPNSSTEDVIIRGFMKISAWNAKPSTGWWNIGDVSKNITRGDGRPQIKEWMCVQAGMFKAVSVTGTTSIGSPVITGISSTVGIKVGDFVKLSAGFPDASYPFFISAVTSSTITISQYNASGAGAVTITNAVPVFTAMGGGYGTTANRPTLTTDDKGFTYFDTDISSQVLWSGTAWVSAAASQWTVLSGTAIAYGFNVSVGKTSTPRGSLDAETVYLGTEGSTYGILNSGNDIFINANADNAGGADGNILFGWGRTGISGGKTLATIGRDSISFNQQAKYATNMALGPLDFVYKAKLDSMLIGVGATWLTSGANLYYTAGSVGIGTSATPRANLDVDKIIIGVEGSSYGILNSGNDIYINANSDNAGLNDGDIYLGYQRATAGSGGTTSFKTGINGSQFYQPLTLTHIAGSTSAPGIAAGTAAGTGPTVSMISGSTDLAGEISVLTGSAPSNNNVLCTITFNVAYASMPFVVATASNSAAGKPDFGWYVTRVSATQFQIAVTDTAPVATTTYKFTYMASQ